MAAKPVHRRLKKFLFRSLLPSRVLLAVAQPNIDYRDYKGCARCPVDPGARHELLDINDMSRLGLRLFELFLGEEHIAVLGDLIALLEIATRHLFAGVGVDGLHLDPVVGLGIGQDEADGSASVAVGQRTRARRRCPSQLGRAATFSSPTQVDSKQAKGACCGCDGHR